MVTLGLGCTVWYGFVPGTVENPPLGGVFAPLDSYKPFYVDDMGHYEPGFRRMGLLERTDVSASVESATNSVHPFSEIQIPASGPVIQAVGLGVMVAFFLANGGGSTLDQVAKKESLETYFNHLSLEDNMPILPPPIFRQLDASDIELMIGGWQPYSCHHRREGSAQIDLTVNSLPMRARCISTPSSGVARDQALAEVEGTTTVDVQPVVTGTKDERTSNQHSSNASSDISL